jgi:hypothetical protein
MSGSTRRGRVAVGALTCGAVAGISVLAAIAQAGGSVPPTDPDSTIEGSSTTGIPAFTDGEDARRAAEELIGAYIESEFGVEVTDAACSVPATGDVGDEFACYGLKPGNLVIALRATVGEQRLIELELLVDQSATTTTSAGQQTTEAS